MKNLIKNSILTLITLSSCMLFPASALAVDVITPVCDGTNNIDTSQVCQDNLTDSDSNPLFGPDGIMTIAINIISIVAAIVAIIIIIIAGIKFMTSQGNPQSISTARNQIIYAAVALVVTAVAQGLVIFVLRKL